MLDIYYMKMSTVLEALVVAVIIILFNIYWELILHVVLSPF